MKQSCGVPSVFSTGKLTSIIKSRKAKPGFVSAEDCRFATCYNDRQEKAKNVLRVRHWQFSATLGKQCWNDGLSRLLPGAGQHRDTKLEAGVPSRSDVPKRLYRSKQQLKAP